MNECGLGDGSGGKCRFRIKTKLILMLTFVAVVGRIEAAMDKEEKEAMKMMTMSRYRRDNTRGRINDIFTRTSLKDKRSAWHPKLTQSKNPAFDADEELEYDHEMGKRGRRGKKLGSQNREVFIRSLRKYWNIPSNRLTMGDGDSIIAARFTRMLRSYLDSDMGNNDGVWMRSMRSALGGGMPRSPRQQSMYTRVFKRADDSEAGPDSMYTRALRSSAGDQYSYSRSARDNMYTRALRSGPDSMYMRSLRAPDSMYMRSLRAPDSMYTRALRDGPDSMYTRSLRSYPSLIQSVSNADPEAENNIKVSLAERSDRLQCVSRVNQGVQPKPLNP